MLAVELTFGGANMFYVYLYTHKDTDGTERTLCEKWFRSRELACKRAYADINSAISECRASDTEYLYHDSGNIVRLSSNLGFHRFEVCSLSEWLDLDSVDAVRSILMFLGLLAGIAWLIRGAP